ncbi:MAG: MFS transporter [Pseudomonadota bacterium]
MSSSGSAVAARPGAFSPFAFSAFALLWSATLVSNTGTWMHEVGAGWLMTTLNPSPAVVTLVQAATTMPVFLFALFAGTLADRLDKRRMLLVINVLLTLVIATLALLVWTARVTPVLLILFTFAIGTGAAFMAPAWQAIVPELVPRDRLKPAIALNSMGINISRAIGPALAGILIASVGLAAPFAVNAASHTVIIVALLLWRPDPQPGTRHHGSMLSDMATGVRHVRYNAPMRATIIRAAGFFLFASAYWSLLPLIARGADGGGSELYGVLMALIGGGAVVGALLLPTVQGRLSLDQTVKLGTVGTAAALGVMALSGTAASLMIAAFLGGVSWIAVLTSFNVSAQTALPNWVRARGLAVFLTVFFGSMALGALAWGQLAAAADLHTALVVAAIGMIAAMWLTRRFEIGGGEDLDLSAADIWPMAPALSGTQTPTQRALVTVTYKIRRQDEAAFKSAIQAFSAERYRDGATRWDLCQSVEESDTWVETFHLPSWAEHLEQHKRVTKADAHVQESLRAFDTRASGPVVRHFIRLI